MFDMSDKITKEIFDHMVQLAALELDEKEAEYLRRELNNQLKAIDELEAIPIDPETPIASHGVPYTAAISAEARDDEWIPWPDPEAILAQAPESEERFFVVPDIPHEDLE
jgi:aspartyl-tRNA(Asn)/glutamyl-tRNA(Gln) amidotransferase subunit C